MDWRILILSKYQRHKVTHILIIDYLFLTYCKCNSLLTVVILRLLKSPVLNDRQNLRHILHSNDNKQSKGYYYQCTFNFFKNWAFPSLFFLIFVFLKQFLKVDSKSNLRTGFEPHISDFGSNRSTNWVKPLPKCSFYLPTCISGFWL